MCTCVCIHVIMRRDVEIPRLVPKRTVGLLDVATAFKERETLKENCDTDNIR